jgi:hypothetical protein
MLDNPAVKRAWRTFAQAFVALYVVYLLPFLTDVMNWAEGGAFPDTSVLAKAGVAATAAGAVALVSYLQNYAEDKTGKTLPTMSK